ncbi:hypothetical protein [Rhodoferax sp. TH121]|uniref:hypothetical protein n=1 Tax=Rhodoferax sp. TH121 TaxID=2022803 RepID=UPI00113FCA2E|nr:hypothetical protein [Rhodoferax sp. TH121]
MIGFTFYKTYGVGCDRMWFRRTTNKRGKSLWQQVVRFGIFYWPVGPLLIEDECNYYLPKAPA